MNVQLHRRWLTLLLPLFAACATVPKPLDGQFAGVIAKDVATSGRTGDRVRWGGVVIEVEPEAQRTCIQVLSRALTATSRPSHRDISAGRFLACRAGFYDPEVFTKGREVTVTGQVAAIAQRPVGDYAYTMPEVAADVIYLWPQRPDYDRVQVQFSPWFGYWRYDPWWFHGGFHYRHPRPHKSPEPIRSDSGKSH